MAFYQLEIFGKVDYDDSLTYEEVSEIEAELISNLQELFVILGAEHIDFFPVGDGIHVYFEMREDLIDPIKKACQEIQAMLQEHVRMKIIVVNKSLTSIHSYSINNFGFEEYITQPFPEGV